MLVTYIFMLGPAIAGAIWQWPWLATYGLITPGAIAHEILGYKAAQARGIRRRKELPSSKRVTILVGFAGLVGVLVLSGGSKYALPLWTVIGLLVFIEPAWRLEWRHHSRRLRAWRDQTEQRTS
jgi:hypothetical protein